MEHIKNVLSIDMDYILNYNSKIFDDIYDKLNLDNYSLDYKTVWDNIYKYISKDKFNYDIERYNIIKNLIAHHSTYTNITFGKEHSEILDILPEKEKYNICNVDFHHDIYYNSLQKQRVIKNNDKNLACWVFYLYKNNMLNHYIWIPRRNSKKYNFMPDIYNKKEFENFVFPESYLTKLFNVKFDYVFICQSEHYFPYHLSYLYEDLKFNNKKEVT